MRIFTFIMGGIVGVVLFMYIMSLAGYNIVRQDRVISYPSVEAKKTKAHYFTVNGPKGEVVLNTEMKRDSVRILLGKPTKTEFYGMGSGSSETWTYEIPGKNYFPRILTVDFKDEKLESVSEI